jgi:UDPglucose 6-dehydrogenase
METAEASWNPRYGIRDFGPFNGSCLPKDTAAFLAFAKDTLGTEMPILSAVIEANRALEKEKAKETARAAPLLPAILKDTPSLFADFSGSPSAADPAK